MARLWFLRRPLLLFAAVAAVVAAYVGVASALNAQHQRHRDQAFQAWVRKSRAVSDAKLPALMRKFSAVRLPAYVHSDGRAPHRVGGNFGAVFGPWSSSRSAKVSSAALVAALRAAGFADVTVASEQQPGGSKINASAPEGAVRFYVGTTSSGASRIDGFLEPHLPRCC